MASEVLHTDSISRQDKASHPVGTTIRITSLFEQLPVRKQSALKDATKGLSKIRKMLQSYALARPSVRFSLKILKAKSEKGNSMYVPKSNEATEDAAFKVVGKEAASQCSWTTVEDQRYGIRAFLPRTDADASKISGIGHFISIDGRPVVTSRGCLRQLITKFRERLRASNKSFEQLKEPFAWIRITCPSGSYDANVEPAKDDVLFQDPDKVLLAFGAVLDHQYPRQRLSPVSEESTSPRQSNTINNWLDHHRSPEPEQAERHDTPAGTKLQSSPQHDQDNSLGNISITNNSTSRKRQKLSSNAMPKRSETSSNDDVPTPPSQTPQRPPSPGTPPHHQSQHLPSPLAAAPTPRRVNPPAQQPHFKPPTLTLTPSHSPTARAATKPTPSSVPRYPPYSLLTPQTSPVINQLRQSTLPTQGSWSALTGPEADDPGGMIEEPQEIARVPGDTFAEDHHPEVNPEADPGDASKTDPETEPSGLTHPPLQEMKLHTWLDTIILLLLADPGKGQLEGDVEVEELRGVVGRGLWGGFGGEQSERREKGWGDGERVGGNNRGGLTLWEG